MKNMEITVERDFKGSPREVASHFQIDGEPATITAEKCLGELWLKVTSQDGRQERTWYAILPRAYESTENLAQGDYLLRANAPGDWGYINDFAELSLSILDFDRTQREQIGAELQRLRSRSDTELWYNIANAAMSVHIDQAELFSTDDDVIHEAFQRNLMIAITAVGGFDRDSEGLCSNYDLKRALGALMEATMHRREIERREDKRTAEASIDSTATPENCPVSVTADAA